MIDRIWTHKEGAETKELTFFVSRDTSKRKVRKLLDDIDPETIEHEIRIKFVSGRIA